MAKPPIRIALVEGFYFGTEGPNSLRRCLLPGEKQTKRSTIGQADRPLNMVNVLPDASFERP
jgi:hypothetical protein